MNTENAIKIFDAGGLKVTRAVPEKHIINFFWPKFGKIFELYLGNLISLYLLVLIFMNHSDHCEYELIFIFIL